MAGQKTLISEAEGVELIRNDLVNNGAVVATVFYITTLRSPETRQFATKNEAENAFAVEVAMCRDSDFVQSRLRY